MHIQELPAEMVFEILKHLDTPKKTTFDLKLHLVCKSFFYCCRSLELSKLNRGIPSSIRASNHPLAREIKAGQGKIKELEIHSSMDVEEIGKFLIKNKEIKDLKISTIVCDSFEIHYLLQKLKHLPLLENVAIQFQRQNTLGNLFTVILKNKTIVKIINSCPKLKSFSLHLPYSGSISSETFEAFSKLKDLKILKLKNLTLLAFDDIFKNKFPQLKRISIPNQLHPIIINTFFDIAPNLTSCSIAMAEFGINEIEENTINKLKKLKIYVSFREIVNEGLFNLEKMHFFYNEPLEEFCERFQDFEKLRNVTIEPFGNENIREIRDFDFFNDVTLTLFNFGVNFDEEDLGIILSNHKIKHLVISDTLITEKPYFIEEHSLESISLKGFDYFINHNIQILSNHNLTKLIKIITLTNEAEKLKIDHICKCKNLEELKIYNGKLIFKGKKEIFSYLIDQAKLRGENLELFYPFLIERMCIYNHPIKDLLDFISDHHLEDQIFELNLFDQIDEFKHRFLKLPNLERLSFYNDFCFFEGRKEILDFLTNDKPLVNKMLRKRSYLENLDIKEAKKNKIIF